MDQIELEIKQNPSEAFNSIQIQNPKALEPQSGEYDILKKRKSQQHENKLGKKHKSHGLRITKERLQVFESLMGNKFNLEIHDLKNEEGKPKGTEIKLMLPCR